MSQSKFRLVTRSDFDGLVCAVLLNLKFLRLSTQKPLDFCASPSEGRQWAVFFEFQM